MALLAAISHPQRLRVIAEFADGRVYVSELARRLGMSRPLLHLHLERLEKAGPVVGTLERGEDGISLKYFELSLFKLHLNLADPDGLDSVDETGSGVDTSGSFCAAGSVNRAAGCSGE
ncbi:ArsR/SmtB family transcription factor [Streptomyces rubiginosohelvolus]|uniref:ArsR/SmtB family transcription factor n=1 Tax=Streptomyces rubiginosohelvolus TaxID=67362 RepID=UPI0036329818